MRHNIQYNTIQRIHTYPLYRIAPSCFSKYAEKCDKHIGNWQVQDEKINCAPAVAGHSSCLPCFANIPNGTQIAYQRNDSHRTEDIDTHQCRSGELRCVFQDLLGNGCYNGSRQVRRRCYPIHVNVITADIGHLQRRTPPIFSIVGHLRDTIRRPKSCTWKQSRQLVSIMHSITRQFIY